jgi:hypothetical protein
MIMGDITKTRTTRIPLPRGQKVVQGEYAEEDDTSKTEER